MEIIQLSDIDLSSNDPAILVFTGRYLKNAIEAMTRRNLLHKNWCRDIYYFPENSLCAYQRIKRGKEIYRISKRRRIVFTFDRFIMDCIFKMNRKDNYAQTVKAYNCVEWLPTYEVGYVDLSDNIPEMFRENSEAMQTLLLW